MNRFPALALAFALSPTIAFASERIESSDVAVLAQKAEALGKKYGKANVLIAYDIDNTLLDLNQDLGSDQWFNWQASLLPTASPPPDAEAAKHAVAKDFNGLLDAWIRLIFLSGSRPTDPRSPGIVSDLQGKGFRSVVVTARSPTVRDATLRELGANGYNFGARPLPMPPDGQTSAYVPKDVKDARPIDYVDGVLLTTGQNKGTMLKALVARSKARIKAVLFIDDTARHVDHVQEAFAKSGIDVVTIRYGFDDAKVAAFKAGSKDGVAAAWRTIQETLAKVFPR